MRRETTRMHLVPWSRKDTSHAAVMKLTKRQAAEVIEELGEQAARYVKDGNLVLAYLAWER